MKSLAWHIDLNGVDNTNMVKYTYPNYVKKKPEALIKDTLMVFKKDYTSLSLVDTWSRIIGTPN